jgi:2-C-methyl-D-erythritol 4-phosphate cytidylyltransferase
MKEQAAAVIVAAGNSSRMQGHDKLWMELAGRSILARTIDIFDTSPLISDIILVSSSQRITEMSMLCQQERWQKISAVVTGGKRRQDSVRNGLDMLAQVQPDCRWVMIHDAARPLVTHSIIERGLLAAIQHQAVIAAVPVKDTIKEIHNDQIIDTPDRAKLWAIQTPQVFSFPLIQQAHHSPLASEDMTDDATLLERLGYAVTIFPGSYTNIKITTEEDLLIAAALLQKNSN